MASHQPDLTALRILIVDDNPDAADILRAYLESLGASVTVARDGKEAVDVLADVSTDIIVSDLSMPAHDGIEFITSLRAREAGRGVRTPAIAFSAFSGVSTAQSAVRAGFDAFMPKPIDPVALALRVASLTRRACPPPPS